MNPGELSELSLCPSAGWQGLGSQLQPDITDGEKSLHQALSKEKNTAFGALNPLGKEISFCSSSKPLQILKAFEATEQGSVHSPLSKIQTC